MGAKSLGRFALRALSVIGVVVLVTSLALLAKTTQNSEDFGRMHVLIVLLNVFGVALLLALILVSVLRLVRDYRKGIPGARLKGRMIAMFVPLAIVPIMLVYLYSMYFLNRGIDSYFTTEVERGLDDALSLSRSALDLRTREEMDALRAVVRETQRWQDGEFAPEIDRLRRELRADELTVYGANRRIIATSTTSELSMMPVAPPEDILRQARQGVPRVTLEPLADGGLIVHAAMRMERLDPGQPTRIAHATFSVPPRLSELAASVQGANKEYDALVFLREPLKDSFKLTLTLVLLVSLLIALWGVFFFARRIVAPIQNLVAGTRAVAAGDFDMRLPEKGSDDVGFLVRSFNDMTRRLADARELAIASQSAMETERASLKAILARLSTGVVALETDLTIRNYNEAAGAILGVDFDGTRGRALHDVARGQRLYEQFVEVCQDHLQRGDREWREQIVLRGEVGRRVLMCACTALPFENQQQPGGYVVVFDDVTAVLQAQRDAAWGEVARRLAHEIKNPLTPIQLSAERLRRRYLETMDAQEAELLERATRTIVQQVESMKDMVDAFRDYARAPDIDVQSFDLNRLIVEVTDLYRSQELNVRVTLDLAEDLGAIDADSGRLRQILHNLLRNSIEALSGRDEPSVTVRTRSLHERGHELAELRVEDNGPGFDDAIMESLFDPYVTSKPKGTGLGLAIVKKLVEEHAGQLRAGNAEGGGAYVQIILPLNEESRSVMMARAMAPGESRRERA
ncbi:MAG: ATP-binding protein [Gammaproteobacteria bacterium]